MARLPISRVVDVTLSKLDRFATRRGFGVPLILTSVTTGPISASVRTKVYGSMDEVAEDWASTTEAYKAALAMFSQNPRPRQIKIGFVAAGVLTTPTPSPTIQAEMDALYLADPDWYWLGATKEFRDTAMLDKLMEWVDAKGRQFHIESNAAGLLSSADTANVAARNKGQRARSGVFYHSSVNQYPALAMIAYAARRDFDQRNTAYTAKFKRLIGIDPVNIGSAAVQAVTGFVPGIGLDAAQGHLANTYVNIGGLNMIVEGSLLDGSFVDELHAADWIITRTEEELLSALANNDVVPYTNKGIQILVSAVEGVLNRSRVAGLIGETTDPDTGELVPEYEIAVERVENIPASQRRQRIAPVIDARFRYAGAVHYTSARFTMAF